MQTWLKGTPIIWSFLWSLIIEGRPKRPCRSKRVWIIEWWESMTLIKVFAAAHRIESWKWRESLVEVLAAAHRIKSWQWRESLIKVLTAAHWIESCQWWGSTLVKVSTAMRCIKLTKWWESRTLVEISTATHWVEPCKCVTRREKTTVVNAGRIKPWEAVKAWLWSLVVIMRWIARVEEWGARNRLVKSKCASLSLEWFCSNRIQAQISRIEKIVVPVYVIVDLERVKEYMHQQVSLTA